MSSPNCRVSIRPSGLRTAVSQCRVPQDGRPRSWTGDINCAKPVVPSRAGPQSAVQEPTPAGRKESRTSRPPGSAVNRCLHLKSDKALSSVIGRWVPAKHDTPASARASPQRRSSRWRRRGRSAGFGPVIVSGFHCLRPEVTDHPGDQVICGADEVRVALAREEHAAASGTAFATPELEAACARTAGGEWHDRARPSDGGWHDKRWEWRWRRTVCLG